jgi:hypothetical protein
MQSAQRDEVERGNPTWPGDDWQDGGHVRAAAAA